MYICGSSENKTVHAFLETGLPMTVILLVQTTGTPRFQAPEQLQGTSVSSKRGVCIGWNCWEKCQYGQCTKTCLRLPLKVFLKHLPEKRSGYNKNGGEARADAIRS